MQSGIHVSGCGAGEVDVIAAYTSDGRVDQFALHSSRIRSTQYPPYDAILLISPKRIDDAAFLDALRHSVDAIPVETMREANRRASEGASA